MAKNKPRNKENKGTNATSKNSSQSLEKAPAKKMTIEEKKLQLMKALEKLEKQEKEAKRLEEIEKMRLKSLELDSYVPTLMPTVANGYNLNKRILADVYLKELTHHIFLVWLDSLYGSQLIDTQVIRTAIDPLILKGKKFCLEAENIFIMSIETKSRIQPVGCCFVLLPKDRVGEDETEIIHRIVKHRSRMVIVDKLMLVKHMKLKHLLIFSNGYKDLVKTIPAQHVKALKPVGTQNDLNDQPKALLSPDIAQQPAISDAKLPTSAQSQMTIQFEGASEKHETIKKNAVVEQTVTSDHSETSSQSTSEDSDEDDCKIIDAPVFQQPTQVIDIDAPAESEVKEFIPVTEETLPRALALMDQFENQKRAVAIVFDSCFFLETINMKIVKAKFNDIFGDIEDNQVLIRINSPKLAVNLDEAKSLGVKALNQAYIIAQQGLTEGDINRRAAARNVFCCPMTLGCVVNNLKRGVFMMHKGVLEGQAQVGNSAAPQLKRSTTSESDNITDLNNTAINKSNESINSKRSNSLRGKRNRIAAVLGTTPEAPREMEQPVKEQTKPLAIKKSASTSGKNIPLNDADKEILANLMQHGDAIISINNLPPKLSVLALNLMLGTFTIKPEQVIASIKQVKGNQDLMDVMIIINKNSGDVERILSKNGHKTCQNSLVVAKLTSPLKLSRFIRSRAIHTMDANMNLPVNKIGYSTESH